MNYTILNGDALDMLRTLPDESVQCCVTSPPYFGLRDYGMDGQIGLEPTPDAYVARLVEVFREVRRVLRDDGVCWLNLGDSYAMSTKGSSGKGEKQITNAGTLLADRSWRIPDGLKPKDLIGIPWRVAFALQADGWYLRADVIWHKPNPMPESVTDRPTKAHEYVFLLAKGQRVSRVVKLADLSSERVHFGQDIRPKSADVWANQFAVGLATAILDAAKCQDKFGLASLDPKVWQQSDADSDGVPVRGLPAIQRAAICAARLLTPEGSPKDFLGEVYRLGITLSDGDKFLIGGIDSKFTLPPTIHRYGERAIAIHDSGEIGEFDVIHGTIIASRPTTCKYFYDAQAVSEEAIGATGGAPRKIHDVSAQGRHGQTSVLNFPWLTPATTRNRRSVWTISTRPYSGAHFATMPPDLARVCVLAGTSERGCCPTCGAPWERVVERIGGDTETNTRPKQTGGMGSKTSTLSLSGNGSAEWAKRGSKRKDLGWRATCDCPEHEPIPCTVLDPFAGSGTTLAVAVEAGRNGIGIELNPEYIELAHRRIAPAKAKRAAMLPLEDITT